MSEPFPNTSLPEQISQEFLTGVPVLAHEVFFTAEQLEDQVAAAYDAGAIPTQEQAEDPRFRITYHIGIDDLNPQSADHFSEMDRKYGKQGNLEDFSYQDPEAVKSGIATELRRRTVQDVARDNGWYLQRQELRENIENGSISEAYSLNIGDKSIPLVNFTDQHLSAEQVEDIRDALEKVANVTRGSVVDRTNMIYIESPERMGEGHNGSAQLNSGTIAINSDVLTGKFDEINARINSNIGHLGTYLSQLTVHELGHIVDDEIKDSSLKFGDALGWTRSYADIAPDTPDPNSPYIVNKVINRRGTPAVTSKVLVHGEPQEVSTIGHFGPELFLNSAPVTKYGNTDHREDFAESFIPYVLDEDKLVLDALRHNAVANIVHDTSGNVEGDIHVEAAQIDPRAIFKGTLELPQGPVTYAVKVMVDNLGHLNGGKKPVPSTVPKVVSLPSWSPKTRKVTDDYGNEVTARPRVLVA